MTNQQPFLSPFPPLIHRPIPTSFSSPLFPIRLSPLLSFFLFLFPSFIYPFPFILFTAPSPLFSITYHSFYFPHYLSTSPFFHYLSSITIIFHYRLLFPFSLVHRSFPIIFLSPDPTCHLSNPVHFSPLLSSCRSIPHPFLISFNPSLPLPPLPVPRQSQVR